MGKPRLSQALVDEYLCTHGRILNAEHRRFDGLDVVSAIELATSKKHGTHQNRIRNGPLKDFKKGLVKISQDIDRCEDFDSLISTVRSQKVKWINDLTIYDVTRRIGASKSILPEKVYLHAGAYEGARLLGFNKKVITVDELKGDLKILKQLLPFQIENFLCSMRKKFRSKIKGDYPLDTR